ncbi:MAG: TolC family protein [Treponema sp.]|nr:TolC family protein [Treponema sp.]
MKRNKVPDIKKKSLLIAVVFIFTGFHVTAQTINLEQARSLALANSRNLAKYNLAIQSSILDERFRIYSNLPSLSLGANASTSLWNAGGEPAPDPLEAFKAGANFSVSQKIFEGGKTLVQKAINGLATETARKDALAEYFNVLNTVDGAYYAALEAAADLEAAESALQTANLSLSMAEVRQASGVISTGDYLKALADRESSETSRNQARRNYSLSNAKLKSLIGLNEAVGFNAGQVDFSRYEELILRLGSITDTEADSLYGELREIAAAANPALAKAGLSSRRAEKSLSLSKLDFSPGLSASFSTGLNYTPNNGIEPSGGSVSISGSIPLDFWVTANNVAKSKIARDTATLDYYTAENSLEAELQSALFNTIAQAGSAGSSRRALEYAEKHFEYIMERYRLSQSSVSELSDASALVSSSRSQFIKARYGFLQGLSTLRSLGAFEDEEKLMQILKGKGP